MNRDRVIPFSKIGVVGLIFSFVVTLSMVAYSVFFVGEFNLGIDFRSGQTIDVELSGADSENIVENILSSSFEQVQVTRLGNTTGGFNIKIPSNIESQDADLEKVTGLLESAFDNVSILSTSFIGSGISQNLLRSVSVLTLGALLLILLYIWLRFKLQFAFAAIFALIHDTLFIIGIIGVFQFEITVSTIAAILTIIGYSLNDTIVIFDRIRENIIIVREGGFRHITDKSITQTLSRTLITSITTLLAVAALVWFALGDVYNFARTLMIGIIAGTWSSLFIATPLLHLFNSEKILIHYRKKQGTSVQYTTQEIKDSSKKTVEPQAKELPQQAVSQEEISRIKEAVRSKQTKHKSKRRKK